MNDQLYRPFLDAWPFIRRRDLRRGLRVAVAPAAEPIDLATAWAHLRLTPEGSPLATPDDALISMFISAARESCEQYLGASLAPQTLELTLAAEDGGGHFQLDTQFGSYLLPRTIALPFGPLLGVESFAYLSGGASVPFSGFAVDTYTDRIRLTSGDSWPPADDAPNAIVIRYQAGYSLPGDSPQDIPLPASLRAAILVTLSNIYDNCAQGTVCDINSLPVGVHYLLDPYRRRWGFA